MPVNPDSIENFQRAGVGNGLLGVYDNESGMVYLALAQPRDDATFDILDERRSKFRGETLDPLPGAGGHARLAQIVGLNARQVSRGFAAGPVFGFSIVKTDRNKFELGTLRSGFNQMYVGDRPVNARSRTLPRGAAFSPDGGDYTLVPNQALLNHQAVIDAEVTMTEVTIRPLLSELMGLVSQNRRRYSE